MEVFLAYFDLLGFKEFILNNDSDHIRRRMDHLFRDIEMALGQGEFQEPRDGIILSDLSQSSINCLNISDTIIFWTKDDSLDSLKELIPVAYRFNWQVNLHNFPVRGALTKGDVEYSIHS